MPDTQLVLLIAAIALVAFLYSSVGHAGASGYIAVMSLASLPPSVIKPGALVLNILVATIAGWQFVRAGHFSWRLFWPFVPLAIPLAFLGGSVDLDAATFRFLVGLVLLASAAYFFWRPAERDDIAAPGTTASLLSGGVLGFFAGLTGTGGGIFLTPLMLAMRWARTRQAAATSAWFILVNSIAGLAGNISSTRQLPSLVLPMAVAAVLGGAAGSRLGSRHFQPAMIKRLLAVVLVIAGLKLTLTPA